MTTTSGDVTLRIPFAITVQGDTQERIVQNLQGDGRLRVIKHGEGDVLLPDVEFDIFHTASEEKVGELTTNEGGEAEITLPLGRYYLKETKAANGYLLPTGTVSVALTEDGAIETVDVANTEIAQGNGVVHVLKTDEDKKFVANAGCGKESV